MAKRLDGSRCHLVGGRPWPRRQCARCGPSSAPQKGDTAPNFRPMSIVAFGWVNQMPLGMEVGLGLSHIVVHGDLAPSSLPQRKGAQPAQFSAHVCCGQTAGWIKIPLGTKVVLGPSHIVLRGDPTSPTSPPKKGGTAHVYCGQTVAHLRCCCVLVSISTHVLSQ